ncbi:MAG: Na/Pi cotransporter family protein [Clostridia bacterium]|nr:Na/Pi cotransporter family protein [Clostridia bacterium]
MSIFNFITLLGGLAIFLFGMSILGEGLEKFAGGTLSKVLAGMTSSPIKGLLLGVGITAAIQSSSAVTVMVVGFVNSGVMAFEQSIGIIMGANIGTTLMSWLLALTGISGSAWYLQILKPTTFTPVLAFIGLILYMQKGSKKRNLGYLFIAFAILMTGMQMMSDTMSPLADNPEFQKIFVMFENPILGLLVGAILTAVIQASSASIGILQALSATGGVTYAAAIPIILGQNIGTCITALLSSVGANKSAKRVSVVHLLFNILGAVIFMVVFYGLNAILHFSFLDEAVTGFGIPIIHSCFNIIVTIVLFPMNKLLAKLAYIIIPESKHSETMELLDERFLSTPSVAVEQCRKAVLEMAECVKNALELSMKLFKKYDEKTATKILEYEDETDKYEDKIGTYLVRLSERSVSEEDSHRISLILHIIGDWERIGDHCVNLLDSAKEMQEKGITFSADAQKDIDVIAAALREVLDLTEKAFEYEDYEAAKRIEPLEEVIDSLRYQLKERHIQRLQQGNCGIETGFVFSDMLTSMERISDHCSNVAVAMIEISESAYDRHDYLAKLKHSDRFEEEFEQFSDKYKLSE